MVKIERVEKIISGKMYVVIYGVWEQNGKIERQILAIEEPKKAAAEWDVYPYLHKLALAVVTFVILYAMWQIGGIIFWVCVGWFAWEIGKNVVKRGD